MTYDTLIKVACNEVPEFKKSYDKELMSGSIDSEAGNYTVFSIAFMPVIIDSIKNNHELAEKIFAFLEEMENCADNYVQEICEFEVLERLCDDYTDDVLMPLLGKETLKGYMAIRRYTGIRNE